MLVVTLLHLQQRRERITDQGFALRVFVVCERLMETFDGGTQAVRGCQCVGCSLAAHVLEQPHLAAIRDVRVRRSHKPVLWICAAGQGV